MPPEGSRVKLITLHLPETYLKELDGLVDERFYYSRADAIRSAVRDLLSREVWERSTFSQSINSTIKA